MKDINPCVLDFETNILNNTVGKNKASSFWPENGIVAGMFKWDNGGRISLDIIGNGKTAATPLSPSNGDVVKKMLSKCNMLVGHNIKFDLLYLRKFYNELYLEWLRNGGVVWDTQIVEYLLTGQEHTYPTLDQCSAKYGGTIKPDAIKEYWKKGIDTAKIPIDELLEYLTGDVNNTELIFEKQVEIAMDEGMYPLITTQMDALLALVEAEYNGMAYNKEDAYEESLILKMTQDSLLKDILTIMETFIPKNLKGKISPASPVQLSTMFFGGRLRCVVDEVQLDGSGKPIIYKSGIKKGQKKTKKVDVMKDIDGMGLAKIETKGKSGYYPTDDDTLVKIVKKYSGATKAKEQMAAKVAERLILYRTLTKDINTYYDGLLALVFPDGYIHPNYNQCSTATGRLSSSSPNAQNISGKKE